MFIAYETKHDDPTGCEVEFEDSESALLFAHKRNVEADDNGKTETFWRVKEVEE